MSIPRWFYWLFAFALSVLTFMLGLGWVVVYKSTDRKVQDEINTIVKAAATQTQNENVNGNNLAAAYNDKDYKSKLAFAIGMTQNQAKMNISFDDDDKVAPSKEKAPTFDKNFLQIIIYNQTLNT